MRTPAPDTSIALKNVVPVQQDTRTFKRWRFRTSFHPSDMIVHPYNAQDCLWPSNMSCTMSTWRVNLEVRSASNPPGVIGAPAAATQSRRH